MHVFLMMLHLRMVLTLEAFLISYLNRPLAQDDFKSSTLERLLQEHFDVLETDYVEDVIQILHKCIIELEKLQVLKYKFICKKENSG